MRHIQRSGAVFNRPRVLGVCPQSQQRLRRGEDTGDADVLHMVRPLVARGKEDGFRADEKAGGWDVGLRQDDAHAPGIAWARAKLRQAARAIERDSGDVERDGEMRQAAVTAHIAIRLGDQRDALHQGDLPCQRDGAPLGGADDFRCVGDIWRATEDDHLCACLADEALRERAEAVGGPALVAFVARCPWVQQHQWRRLAAYP